MMWISSILLVSLFLVIYFFLRACDAANNSDWGSLKVNRIIGFIKLFCRIVHRFQFDSLTLPTKGCSLVASNHISGLDPFLLIAASPRPLRFLIAREEYERFGLNWLFRLAKCIPVDREAYPERALREALTALEQGDVVAVFPHGGIHLETDPARKLKGGVIFLAKQVDCPIYPVRVENVRGAGFTALALFIPSRSRLKTYSPLDCLDSEHAEFMAKLTRVLDSELSSEPE